MLRYLAFDKSNIISPLSGNLVKSFARSRFSLQPRSLGGQKPAYPHSNSSRCLACHARDALQAEEKMLSLFIVLCTQYCFFLLTHHEELICCMWWCGHTLFGSGTCTCWAWASGWELGKPVSETNRAFRRPPTSDRTCLALCLALFHFQVRASNINR